MRSSDFLLQLKKALENELSAAQVQDNVEYYKNYIKEEMKSGKSEQEVMNMLGDPWAIAKTILLEEKMSGTQESVNSEEVWSNQEQTHQSQKIHLFGLDTWWKKAAAILGLIAIIILIISLILGILSIVLPIAIPLILVVTIFNMLRRK
jgi:uncharacterized membrane protein